MSVSTFLERLRTLPEQPLPGAAAARELLAARGLNAATLTEVEDLRGGIKMRMANARSLRATQADTGTWRNGEVTSSRNGHGMYARIGDPHIFTGASPGYAGFSEQPLPRYIQALWSVRRPPPLGLARDKSRVGAILRVMAAQNLDELLAAIRQLPLDERRSLIEQAAREADADTPTPPQTAESAALIGLMMDEPEVVDEMCALVYGARKTARMRILDT